MHHPQQKDLFFIATLFIVMHFLCFLMCLCMEIMERGLWGYFSSKSITGYFLYLNFGVWDCISKTQLCTKEHIGVYNVIRSVISLLIDKSLDFDIQNRVLVVRKNTCCCERVAQCPWGSLRAAGPGELWQSCQRDPSEIWNMLGRDMCY